MKVGIVRGSAVGAALLLCASAVPFVAPSAVAVPASTTLDARQAKSAFVKARATAIDQALRRGARVVNTYEDVDKSKDWIKYRWTATIDAKRKTVRRSQSINGYFAVPAIGYMDSCGGYDPDDVWDLAKAKVGRWDDLDRRTTPPESLRLLGKPNARWTKVVDKRTTMRTLVARSVKGTSYGLDDQLVGIRFHHGTRTATPQGATYDLTFRDEDDEVGRLAMDTDTRGALVRLRAELPFGNYTDSALVTSQVVYGKQRVVAPTKKRWVLAKDRRHACEAADLRRIGVFPVAKGIAEHANWPKGPTSVKDIRDAAKDFEVPLVKVTKIRYGVKVVGHSRLLKHDYAATVFVRNGKAVAHNIR